MKPSSVDNRNAVPIRLLNELQQHYAHRRVGKGFRLLQANKALIDACGPGQIHGGMLLGHYCQWLFIGFAPQERVFQLIKRFPPSSRTKLPLQDYMYLRLADGYAARILGDRPLANHHFEAALEIEENCKQNELKVVANFWIAANLRNMGRFRDALGYVYKARDASLAANYPESTAVIRVLEGWVLFEQGKTSESEKLLKEAEAVLLNTDDYADRGYVYFIYGRIARRRGQYYEALRFFRTSIDEYNRRYGSRQSLSRSLINMAFVKRLLALRTQTKMDWETARSRKAQTGNPKAPSENRRWNERAHITKLREEAFEHLAKAQELCTKLEDYGGQVNIHTTAGYLHLDNGDFDRASTDGEMAYQMAQQKKDHVLIARARILQSAIERAKFDELIEEGPGSVRHAQLAEEFARDAIQHAKETQNERLLAGAYVALGLALCTGASNNVDEMWDCTEQAGALLKPEDKDYLSSELALLKRKVNSITVGDPILSEWSQGIVGDKSFAQISKEFATIIIPNVWEHEGRRISRTAARLSISPKKVRKILQERGLLLNKKSQRKLEDKPSAQQSVVTMPAKGHRVSS
jgi:tetratricopeptide (TPR) repeat protein